MDRVTQACIDCLTAQEDLGNKGLRGPGRAVSQAPVLKDIQIRALYSGGAHHEIVRITGAGFCYHAWFTPVGEENSLHPFLEHQRSLLLSQFQEKAVEA